MCLEASHTAIIDRLAILRRSPSTRWRETPGLLPWVTIKAPTKINFTVKDHVPTRWPCLCACLRIRARVDFAIPTRKSVIT